MEELLKKILLEEWRGTLGWTRESEGKSALELLNSLDGDIKDDSDARAFLYNVLVRLAKETAGADRKPRGSEPVERKELVGKVVLGVDFRDTLEAHNRPGWCGQMAAYVGKKGVIESHSPYDDSYKVRFSDEQFWWYPARLILLQFC